MSSSYILTLDQGTTSSKSIIFDLNGNEIGTSQKEFTQFFPQSGWVEHDPIEIWNTQYQTMLDVISKSGISIQKIKAIGITNQRETTVVWDKYTGDPICNAIVWQDRRTATICEKLKEKGLTDYIKQNTGLVPDAYFSATKLFWILENIPNAREKAEAGSLLFGTIDTWLLWKLTKGKVHATDETNASRTMLYNIKLQDWDQKLLSEFNIPIKMLPKVQISASFFGEYCNDNHSIPITGIAGDQQAALFGQQCFEPGDVKNTYGTGCFMLMHTGKKIHISNHGLLTTMVCRTNLKEPDYALEGSVFVAGAAIQWLRDGLQLFKNAVETESMANTIHDNGGVYLVPAFVGLGTPYWDMYARGTIIGLTRDSNKNHIVRAALESIAFQTKDVLTAMESDAGIKIQNLKVDGGASQNNFLMQFQSDVLQSNIYKSESIQSTALGACFLAMIGSKIITIERLKEINLNQKLFVFNTDSIKFEAYYQNWKKAVERSRNWATE